MSATVLCVHENRALARQHAEVLEAEGYEVLCAHDGRKTFEILRERHPDFAVLDAYLPRQDGLEILAEMRTLDACRSTPVLLLSEGDVTDDLSVRARRLGAVGVEPMPLPIDRLVARVSQHVKPSTDAADRACMLPTSGALEERPIPELLNGLRAARFDGLLVLERGKKKKAVELREGWPVSVKSNLVSECFGHYLVREGRVPQAALDESAKRMRSGEGLQGEILIAMDVLDEDELVVALRDHALDKFYELFGWRTGRFALRPGAQVQRASSLGLEGHPTALIVEGVRRAYPLKQIDRFLAVHGGAYAVPRANGDAPLAAVGLSEEEREWVASMDGGVTLGVIAAQPEWARRLAFALVSIEFLTIESQAGDAADARAVASQAVEQRAPEEVAADEALRVELAELANRIRGLDHYGVLEVGSDAGDEEIRVAYAALAKRTHPDRFHAASSSVRQLAAQVFERIAEAHAAIATAEARTRYAAEEARGRRLEAVEDEGRRALAAETEFQKGEARMAQRDYEGALVYFGRAMQNFPSEGEYRSYYGWCLYLCHPDNEVMLGEALEHCREGVKLAKDREKPYLLLGRLYKAMGKTVAAKKMFSRAVAIKPQCVEAMRELRIMNMRREGTQGLGKGVLKRIFRR